MNGLSKREKSIAAAAYLKGLAIGLSIDRSKTWHKQVRNSELAATTVFNALDDFLKDGRGFNPIVIYERDAFAERCGLAKPPHAACEAVSAIMHSMGQLRSRPNCPNPGEPNGLT